MAKYRLRYARRVVSNDYDGRYHVQVELECGHLVWRQDKPTMVCSDRRFRCYECAKEEKRQEFS